MVYSQGARIGVYCFELNSKIWKLVNTRGIVKQQFSQEEMGQFRTVHPNGVFMPTASGPTNHIANQDVRS